MRYTKESIRQLIEQNRLDEAIDILQQQIKFYLLQNKEDEFIQKFKDILVINSNKLNDLIYNKNIGSLTQENEKVTKAEILKATLYVINKISDNVLNQEDNPSVIWEKKMLRYCLNLGWQIARYEIIYNSKLSEIQEVEEQLKQDIVLMLKQKKFPEEINKFTAQQIIRTILNYYSIEDIKAHTFILIGISSFRLNLISSLSNETTKKDMERLAFSAILEIDDSIISNKEVFFKILVLNTPENIPELIKFIRNSDIYK